MERRPPQKPPAKPVLVQQDPLHRAVFFLSRFFGRLIPKKGK